MSGFLKVYIPIACACAVVGFIAGVVGTYWANYYIMSGPSFPEASLGGLYLLGYPGFLLAGRTGPSGFIEFEPSYRWGAVASWNAVAWAATMPWLLLAARHLLRFTRGRRE